MRPSPREVLLALVLLVTASVAGAQPPPCQTAVRRIELPTGGGAVPPELCISPGLSTTVLFDRALVRDAVLLEGRERFRRVEALGSLLVLVPSEKLQPGERLSLKVRFADAEAPESVSFVLVVYRDQAERQVEVSRPARPADACQGEVQRQEAELQRKEAELQRCLAERAAPPAGLEESALLAQLLAQGAIDDNGLTVQQLTFRKQLSSNEDMPQLIRVTVYRAKTRIVVEVEMAMREGGKAWRTQGASLQQPSGPALQPWIFQPAPLLAGDSGSVWVEISNRRVHGSYTLELWDEGKARTITVPGLKFP
ncbi:DUF2381 family protein [Hyalangium versicolor]|uniref:DUF2381 family protein n=1 Tax=Hyalangium versicolor TaxID=2861190 RepID=UPI001CCC154E|nr:DUF2381 family protein [Hyalangium versicolor]